MMAFFEDRFPPCISAEMSGGPRFFTNKAYMVGGQRISNRLTQYPLHRYSMSQPPQTQEEFDDLRAFFYVVGGDADGFRYKDWSDFEVSPEVSSTTLLSTDVYQLNKIYEFGARTFTRPIYKPVAGVQVFRTRSGSTTNITGTTTIDFSTGRITVTGHVALDVYTWSGEFDVPAAFLDPAAVFRAVQTLPILTEWQNLEIEEIRP